MKDFIYFSLRQKYGIKSVLLDPMQTEEGQKIPGNKNPLDIQIMFLVKIFAGKIRLVFF